MFSYKIKLRKINNPNSKLKAFVSIVIDDIMEVDGFKIINGVNGLFVSVPNHKGTVTEDGVQVEKYFDDVRFLGEPGLAFGQEIKNMILQEYNGSSVSTPAPQSRATTAKAHTATAASTPSASESSEPDRKKKPLWGF